MLNYKNLMRNIRDNLNKWMWLNQRWKANGSIKNKNYCKLKSIYVKWRENMAKIDNKYKY